MQNIKRIWLLKCILLPPLVNIYEGFPAISTLARKMCKQIITPPFHFDHLPTQVPKSQYLLEGLESPKIFAPFWGFGSHRAVCLKKAFFLFYFKSELKLEL